MAGTEETPVVASKAEEVVKLNNSFKEACVITKSEQVDDKEKSHYQFLVYFLFVLWRTMHSAFLHQCNLDSTDCIVQIVHR